MELVVRGKRDGKASLFIKLGLALALSITGFVVAQLQSRARRRSHRRPRPPASHLPPSASGTESQAIGKPVVGLKVELPILKSEEAFAKIINGTSTTITTTTTTVVGLSPMTRGSGDHEIFLLPEFNDLVMEEFGANVEATEITTTTPTPRKLEIKEDSAIEQEIARLRNLVWSLQEKERDLELQLQGYYGMQEQEAAMRELERQLNIILVEAKIYSLKIESLEADNWRLEAQLTDISRVMNELEASRATIKLLKKKLKSDGDQAKETIASLHQRVSVFQCQEQKEVKDKEETERKIKKLEELEDETIELKMVNSRLMKENSGLVTKLEAAQTSAYSALEGPEADALEEANCLKEANEKLMEDFEQLRTDRSADFQELVHLRWVNACLRYELRNHQPPMGKTVARDLSKNLSPKSELKVKQLILEYAHSGSDEKSLSFTDFDSGYSSSSQASTGEPEDASIDVSSSTRHRSPKKSKFLRKLKALVLGKDTNINKASAIDRTSTSGGSSGRRISVSISSIDDMIGRDSFGSFSSSMAEELTPANQLFRIDAEADERCNVNARSQIYARPSLDIQTLQCLNLEEALEEKVKHFKRDVGTPYTSERMISG